MHTDIQSTEMKIKYSCTRDYSRLTKVPRRDRHEAKDQIKAETCRYVPEQAGNCSTGLRGKTCANTCAKAHKQGNLGRCYSHSVYS